MSGYNGTSTTINSTINAVASVISPADMLMFKVILASVYLIVGLAVVVIDGALALTILATKELRKRKELLFVLGLFLGDIVFGLGFISSSINRFVALTADLPPLTPMQCMLRPFLPLFIFGQLFSAMMMFMISVDRLLSELNIFLYMRLGIRYRLLGLGLPLFLVTLSTIAAFPVATLNMSNSRTVAAECSQNLALTVTLNTYYSFAQHLPAFCSVLLYACVLTLYCCKRKPKRQQNKQQQKQEPFGDVYEIQRRRQREHTKVLGFVCATNVVLYTVPSIYVAPGTNLTATWPPMVAMCALYFSVISRGLCAIANALVFVLQPNELRKQLMNLFQLHILRNDSNAVVPIAAAKVEVVSL